MVLPANLTYDTVLLFWRIVANLFFREIRPRGAWNIPRDSPIIFVAAPHHNQFLDPVLLASEVLREASRRISFLIAAKSFKRMFVGGFSKLMGSIPVARAEDGAKPGAGHVTLSADDPCRVTGINTRFTSEMAPKSRILLPKSTGFASGEVISVVSDTELILKKEFGGDSGKGTSRVREKIEEAKAAGKPGLDYKILPHVDQHDMYHLVYKKLTEGGCIGIFPEGGSHDRTDLLPLKAGVSLMALGAMVNDPNCNVKIVPVGMSYFHPHRFRSRAVVEFGHPMDVPPELVDMFKEGGDRKREASQKMLDFIYDGLKTVTVRAPDYETLMLIQAGRRLYKTPGQHLTLGQVVELNKRFIEGYLHFQHEPRIQKLKVEVLRYNRFLKDLGLKDHQVPRAKRATWKTLGLLTYRICLLLVWTVLALPGVILNGPIFIVASIMSRKKAREALAASSVKVAGRDVLATWKVLISLGLAPFLYSFYAALATYIAYRCGASLRWKLWTPFLVMLALPCIGFSALKFGEAGMDVLKSLKPLVIALFPGQQKQLDKLKAMRERLSNELSDIINDFGPQLYNDFDEWRILTPSASVPPSSGKPGIWRRKSGTGGVDAQGNLLVHPMSWLDERLFGWSRSAWRGTSAWDRSSSGNPSTQPTPDVSDDEDAGDYDNVLGYLRAYSGETPSRKRARSQQQSYADLQQLRKGEGLSPEGYAGIAKLKNRSDANLAQLAPVYHAKFTTSASPPQVKTDLPTGESPEHSPTDADGLHLRRGGRERRSSLTDNIPVGRIGELSPTESFKEGTSYLNRENEMRKKSTSNDVRKDE